MAAITNYSRQVIGPFSPTKTVLSASDTFTYLPGVNQELVFFNPTAGVLTATIDGDGGTTVAVPGAGAATFSVASGITVTIPIGGFTTIKTDDIRLYLAGTVTITGAATAVVCSMHN